MISRDEELYGLLKPVLDRYQVNTGGDSSDESLFKKIAYSDLREEAEHYLINGDLVFGKNYKKAVRGELYRLKEESYERLIDAVFDSLSAGEDLKKKILDITQSDEVSDIFDEEIASTRMNRIINSKTGNYTRISSKEATYNELIRQLSDLPYPDLRDKVEDLRKQHEELTGSPYKVPATTFKREFVTLRESLGKEIAVKAGVSDKISQLDPSYDYRRISDSVGKIDNGIISEKQQSVINRQVRNLENDVTVLRSYEELATKTDRDIRVSEKLPVKDKISAYRRELAGELVNLSTKDGVSQTSAAFLDLVEDQKQENPDLYKKTAEKLSQELGLGTARGEKLSDKGIPLSSWQDISKMSHQEFDKFWNRKVQPDIRNKKESAVLSGPEKVTDISNNKVVNRFGQRAQKFLAAGDILESVNKVAQSSNFSEDYKALSSVAKKVYDHNFGKPAQEGENFFRTIYDMDEETWARAERAAGFDTPRVRQGFETAENVEERRLQEKISEALKSKDWTPKTKSTPVTPSSATVVPPPNISSLKVSVTPRGEVQNNLEKVLRGSRDMARTNTIGFMGIMGAVALFNVAASGPSDEALARKQRLEEERRLKKYGY